MEANLESLLSTKNLVHLASNTSIIHFGSSAVMSTNIGWGRSAMIAGTLLVSDVILMPYLMANVLPSLEGAVKTV